MNILGSGVCVIDNLQVPFFNYRHLELKKFETGDPGDSFPAYGKKK